MPTDIQKDVCRSCSQYVISTLNKQIKGIGSRSKVDKAALLVAQIKRIRAEIWRAFVSNVVEKMHRGAVDVAQKRLPVAIQHAYKPAA